MTNSALTHSYGTWTSPKRPQIGTIVLPHQDSPFQPYQPKEIFIPRPDKPIVEVPWEFPVEMPDRSKLPVELPIGIPNQAPVELPSGPTVPDWSKLPAELPNPNDFPAHFPHHFPGGPGYNEPQQWILKS